MSIKNILVLLLLFSLSYSYAEDNSSTNTDSKKSFMACMRALSAGAKASIQSRPGVAATLGATLCFGIGFACHASLTKQSWEQSMVGLWHKCQGAWWLMCKEAKLMWPFVKPSLKPKA